MKFPPLDPLYTIRVSRYNSDGTYSYIFWGRFSDIDLSRQIINLTGFDRKNYTFNIGPSLYDDNKGTIWLHVSSIDNPIIIDGKASPREEIFDITDEMPFNYRTVFQVYWTDSRNLDQIQSSYMRDSSEPINTFPIKANFVQFN